MVTTVADVVHLAAMSVWLGGLVMLTVFLLRRADDTELGNIVPVWSGWAAYAVAALAVTGVVQAVVQIGSVNALVSTRYGWLMIAKVGLVFAVLCVAWLSRRLVGPVAAGTPGAARRLRTRVGTETAIAALILATTSVLVQTAPGRAATAAPAAPVPEQVILRDRLFILTVDLVPAQTGLNEVRLSAATPAGRPADVKEWRVRAALPARGIESIDADVRPSTPDHATAQITLPVTGTWTFRFTLRLTDIDEATVAATIVVAPG
jgi:copper transport protein